MNNIIINSLAFSDLLMGFYLALIAAVDVYYHGYYAYNEYSWLNSKTCNVLGFFANLSLEMSLYSKMVLSIFFVYALKNSTEIFEQKNKIRAVCLGGWVVFVFVSTIPFFLFEDNKSNICLYFNIGMNLFTGWPYNIIIYNILNNVMLATLIIHSLKLIKIVTASKRQVEKSGHISGGTKNSRTYRKFVLLFLPYLLYWILIESSQIISLVGVEFNIHITQWMAFSVMPVISMTNPIVHTIKIIKSHSQLTSQKVSSSRTGK
jgi:leucine-rich repeat-containing G protein-coupled receptor 7